MGYTYRLSKDRGEQTEERAVYRLESLKGMTTYQLREICQKERLVVPMGARMERGELIRFIMRYRGIREHRHITDYAEGGMERLQNFLDKVELREETNGRKIAFPAHLQLYEEEAIELTDHYEVSASFSLYEGNLLLVDENNRLYTCMYLKQETGATFCLLKGKTVPLVTADSHKFSLLYFQREEVSDLLYALYYGAQSSIPKQTICIRTPLLAVDIHRPERTALPLIIDFGSSNTTMGRYDDDGSVKVVKVADTAGGRYRESEMIPSVIGIAGTKEGIPIYQFGYEARKLAAVSYQDEDCPVFYDIKRWVSAPERVQEVITAEGIKLKLQRKDMLAAFLKYLIDTGQQQFKCKFNAIQFLTPVRQKTRFEHLFRELLPAYQVECALDEGMAVLFHSIHELIDDRRYEEGMWYQALIMDCGGGTADLTAGRFRIRNNRISYEVDLETGYENGNTNFGGNNLTFRILQLLKVKILEALGDGEFRFDSEVPVKDAGLCAQLNQLYEAAEKKLPTRFAEYTLKGREEYFRIKNNYYYLFEIAETIKESFFQKTFRYELRAGCGEEIPIDKWRISLREKERIVSCRKDFSLLFYLYEIEHILRADIYELMTRFLERPFINGELAEYGMLKLTGQSCKSSLFTEALKEFVPGRLIRNEREGEQGSRLKMCCLEGAIWYFRNLKLGYMKINQRCRANALPYEVTAYTHENREKILIHSLCKEKDIGYISRFKIGEQLDLYLHDESGKELKVYHFNYDVSVFECVTQEYFNETYAGTVIQEQTDTIVEGEIKFFVWPARDKWGFMVLPVLRENEQLRHGEETFFAFEDDTWEENFFDGRK